MSDALLNDLRGKLTEELWRTSVNSGNMSDVTAAIDALIQAHIAQAIRSLKSTPGAQPGGSEG